MTNYYVTVISRSLVENNYEVEAETADEAVDKVLEGIAYDVDIVHVDGETYYV